MTTRSIADIWTAPDRQRKDLGDLSDLINSIAQVGLINPITITHDGQLIAGERRLTACRELGLLSVPVRYLEDLSPRQLKLIEYDENVKRKDIDWKEAVRAVKGYTDVYLEEHPDALGKDIAAELGMSEPAYHRYIGICEYLDKGHPGVVAAPQLSVARGIYERTEARRKATDLDEVDAALKPLRQIKPDGAVHGESPGTQALRDVPPDCPIFLEDFFEFKSRRKFNFIHCDFPYGINADKHDQGAAKAHGGYADSYNNYLNLLQRLGSLDCIAESAHLMFWFSMEYYQETLNLLSHFGWEVNTFPLVWYKSDNAGILPDPKRGPRRVYETAFLAYRGDRPVVQSVSNCVALPSTKKIHMSEKPIPVLTHFFRMFVDEHTIFLDPTCGSGNSVIAASNSGASFVTGLEIDPDFHQLATENWYENTAK